MSQKVNSPEFIGIRCTGYTHLVVLLKTFSVNLPVYQLIPEIFPKGAGGGDQPTMTLWSQNWLFYILQLKTPEKLMATTK